MAEDLAFWVATAIFVATFALIVVEKFHRTVMAMAGASVMIIAGIALNFFQPEAGFAEIDFNTLGLLLGMMIIVGVISETGFFEYLAVKFAKIARGNIWRLMLIFASVTAVASAFLDNVTAILLMVPITISLAKSMDISPIPLILAEVLASNVGGTATLIGDPPNIIIGSQAGISFYEFLVYLAPIVAITFLLSLVILRYLFRKELTITPKNVDGILAMDEREEIKNRELLTKSLIVLAAVIALFLVHHILHIQPALIALVGASVLLVWGNIHPDDALSHVSWTTLLFFAGLFVVVGGVKAVGLIETLASAVVPLTGGRLLIALFAIIFIAAFTSMVVDNIPLTATMIPVVVILAQDPSLQAQVTAFEGQGLVNPMWWALAIGADFGGNGTLVGASANLVAVGLAMKFGYSITFRSFFRKAFPFALITLSLGGVLLVLSSIILTEGITAIFVLFTTTLVIGTFWVGTAILGAYWVWKDSGTWSQRPRRWLGVTLVGGVLGLTAYLIAREVNRSRNARNKGPKPPSESVDDPEEA